MIKNIIEGEEESFYGKSIFIFFFLYAGL